MESNDSEPNKSQPQNSEPPKQKRVYCQIGILESRKNFAKRMYQAMLDAGILKGKVPPSERPTE